MDLNLIMVVLILLSTSTSPVDAASARHHQNAFPDYKHNNNHHNKHHQSSHSSAGSSGSSPSRPLVHEPNSHHSKPTDLPVDSLEETQHLDYEARAEYGDFDEGDLLPQPGTYIPSNCSSCVRREELRQRNLEAIKGQILSKLGLRSAPNMTGRTLPKLPMHLELPHANMQSDAPYNKGLMHGDPSDDYEDDDFHARTERVLVFTQPAPDHVQAVVKDVVYFKFTEKVLRSKVHNATLWVWVRPIAPSIILSPENETWINTFKVCTIRAGESPVISKVRSTRIGLQKYGGWVALEVKKVLAEWLKHPEDNLGFVLQVSDPKSFTFVHDAVTEEDAAFMPFMELTTTENGKVRKKRTIGLNCNENSEETRCCRYPLTVDFEEFGWDWIIAPKKYEANYCSGECPYVFLQKYPHTHIVQQANPAGTAGPCCAPRRMSPISMLYFDHEYNIIYGVLPGMVVDRCGCS